MSIFSIMYTMNIATMEEPVTTSNILKNRILRINISQSMLQYNNLAKLGHLVKVSLTRRPMSFRATRFQPEGTAPIKRSKQFFSTKYFLSCNLMLLISFLNSSSNFSLLNSVYDIPDKLLVGITPLAKYIFSSGDKFC